MSPAGPTTLSSVLGKCHSVTPSIFVYFMPFHIVPYYEILYRDIDIQQSSFSNLSITSPTSQIILQPFCHFTYITVHSPTLLLLHLRHSSFSNPSVASPTSQFILQPFHHFTYITTHSPTLLSLYLHHSSFSKSSVASPTSQFILQPLFCFSCITSSSFNSPGEPPMLSMFLVHFLNHLITLLYNLT